MLGRNLVLQNKLREGIYALVVNHTTKGYFRKKTYHQQRERNW